MSQWYSPFRRDGTRSSIAPHLSRVEFTFPKLFHEGLDEDAVLSRSSIQVVCPEDVGSAHARGHQYVLAARCIHIVCTLPHFHVRREKRRYGLSLHLYSRIWQTSFLRDSSFSRTNLKFSYYEYFILSEEHLNLFVNLLA